MDTRALTGAIYQAYKRMPELDGYLSARTIHLLASVDEFKSFDYFQRHINGLVRGVYSGNIGGEFIDVFANLISGQITDAYNRAWIGDGNKLPLPAYLDGALQEFVANQYAYVDDFFRAIVDARINKSGVDGVLVRGQLWANRFKEAENDAMRLIAEENGGKLIWIEGDTVEKCSTCTRLDGLVAYAKEWATAGFHPQGGPNPALECNGWRCQCRLEQTEKRRSPKVLDTLLNIRMT
jgi:hypothetical protein